MAEIFPRTGESLICVDMLARLGVLELTSTALGALVYDWFQRATIGDCRDELPAGSAHQHPHFSPPLRSISQFRLSPPNGA